MSRGPQSGDNLTENLRLVAPIGIGGMGSVWSAHDSTLDRLVAVKLVGPGGTLDERALARFKREAALAAKLKSPHVVQVFAYGVTEEGTPYIAMELLEGRTLDAELAKGPMAPERVAEILRQLGRALEPAHAAGIVHRDLKPANVFLVDTPGYEVFVKVVDFGIARDTESGEVALTRTGTVVGTPRYMSPEQLLRGESDARSDLWAVAVLTYELLTGAPPFAGATAAAIALAAEKGEYEPASARLAALGDKFDGWFAKALRPKPEDRYASIGELVAAFVRALETSDIGSAATVEQAVTTKTASAPVEGAQRGRSKAPLLVAGVVAAVTVGVVAMVVTNRQVPAPAGSAAPQIASLQPSASAAQSAAPVHRTSVPPSSRSRGRLPPEVIQSTIRTRMSAIQGCYRDQQGTVMRTIFFRIDVEGKPRDVAIGEMDPELEALDACIVEKFSAIPFPRPVGGSIAVTYPILFSPGDDAVLDDSVCGRSFACLVQGRCSARDRNCAATADRDCTVARVCVETGDCSAENGRCVARYADCGPDSKACKTFGLCEAHDGICRATSDARCEASSACATFGGCALDDGRCRPSLDKHCAASTICRDEGRCALEGDSCQASADSMCASSRACKEYGQCTARAGRCAAMKPDDCARSEDCRRYGACAPTKVGTCLPATDEDCAASDRCKHNGECRFKEGRCVGAP